MPTINFVNATGSFTYEETAAPPPGGGSGSGTEGKIEGYNSNTGDSFTVGGVSAGSQHPGKSWNMTQTDDYTMRMELRVGELWTQGDNSSRSEISFNDHYPNGSTLQFAFKVTIEPGPNNAAQWLCLDQLHATTQGSPPYALELIGEKFSVVARAGTSTNEVKRWTDSSNFKRGQSYAFVAEMKLDPNGNGHLKVTKDGATVMDYKGALGIPGAEYYYKHGIYQSKSQTATFARKVTNLVVKKL